MPHSRRNTDNAYLPDSEVSVTRIERAVPVLRVADVDHSVDWYKRVLGFDAECFPDKPPSVFAILTRDGAEIMLQSVSRAEHAGPPNPDTWSVYLRLSGQELLELHDQIELVTKVLAGPWRRFYRDVEFEIADPDGHRLCLGEVLPDSVPLPSPPE
jgi:catechol 2,3-dioxygenase-like lactoylglutathione lyase family enzyme